MGYHAILVPVELFQLRVGDYLSTKPKKMFSYGKTWLNSRDINQAHQYSRGFFDQGDRHGICDVGQTPISFNGFPWDR